MASPLLQSASEAGKGHLRRWWKSSELSPVLLRAGLDTARVVAVMVVKNEATRMPHLLAHYRALGVEQFILVDNQSSDGLQVAVADEADVSVYLATGSYRRARFGNDWVNVVCRRHCVARWVLYVDADELLVFDGVSSLPAVCDLLDRAGRSSLHAVMVDMYGDGRVTDNVVAAGQDPIEVCRLFDATGYESRFEAYSQTTWVKGGVRGRLFFPDRELGPALNKTPLVRWRRSTLFLKSAHQLWPFGLNRGGEVVEGALLHFTFTSEAAAKILDQTQAAAHTSEYRAYGELATSTFVGVETAEYRRPRDLADAGLIRSMRAINDAQPTEVDPEVAAPRSRSRARRSARSIPHRRR